MRRKERGGSNNRKEGKKFKSQRLAQVKLSPGVFTACVCASIIDWMHWIPLRDAHASLVMHVCMAFLQVDVVEMAEERERKRKRGREGETTKKRSEKECPNREREREREEERE